MHVGRDLIVLGAAIRFVLAPSHACAQTVKRVKNGRLASLVLPGATPLQGGLPIVLDGKVIGAIGVSGNTPQEDEDIARAGAAAFP